MINGDLLFIRVKELGYDIEIKVNIDLIGVIYPHDDHTTLLVSGKYIEIQETEDQVVALIEAVMKKAAR